MVTTTIQIAVITLVDFLVIYAEMDPKVNR
jgi:hypothetical protein